MDASQCPTRRNRFALASLVTAAALTGACFDPGTALLGPDGSSDAALTVGGSTGGVSMAESTDGPPDADTTASTADAQSDGLVDSGESSGDADSTLEGAVEGSDDDAGQSTGGDTSTGGEARCEGANVCVAAPEARWNGPVALRDLEIDGLPDCGGDFPDLQVDDAFAGLVAPDFTCGCSCSVGSLACDGSAFVEVSNTQNVSTQSPCGAPNGGNNGLVAGVTVTPVNPFDAPTGALGVAPDLLHGVTVDDVTTEVTGDCVEVPSETPTAAAFTERTAACGATLLDAECDSGEVCVAQPSAPFEAEVCIWAEGEESCPTAYPVQRIRYREIDDQRACSECACGGPDASCSAPTVGTSYWYTLFIVGGGGNPVLSSPLSVDAPSNYCESVDLLEEGFPYTVAHSLGQISFDPGTLSLDNPGAPCPASGGNPVGEATASEALTICCTEA